MRSSNPAVLLLAVHPVKVAATRLRIAQYAEALQDAGLSMEVWTFLTEPDLDTWFGSSQVRRVLVLMRGLLRIPSALRQARKASVIVVQREALPLGPPVLEMLCARRKKLVWDVDDAVWRTVSSPTAGHVPQWLRATGGKYRVLCRRADEVWAGSDVLAAWCRQYNESVHVIPTIVPVPAERGASGSERTVGWIGSHSTGQFLEDLLPAVARVEQPPAVVAVGAFPRIPPHLEVKAQEWSTRSEEEALAHMRVGLYPIDRSHPMAEGKCGLKAVLYMSRGIPTVITPTTTNAAIVRDGIEGLHAETPAQWTACVQRLLDDDALWVRLSQGAHARAVEQYSLQVWGPRVAQRLVHLVERS